VKGLVARFNLNSAVFLVSCASFYSGPLVFRYSQLEILAQHRCALPEIRALLLPLD